MRKTNLRGGSHAKSNWQRMPLSKCIISLVLTVTLVFGIGPKLSYAADVLPDGPQTVTMTNAETKTLVAPSNSFDQATYAWEMFSTELNDFALISGETGSKLKVDPGYFGEDATSVQIRCTVSDENSKASTSQIYNVNLTRENNSVDEALAAATANEEGATTSDLVLGDENDANAEQTVTVNYVDKVSGTSLATATEGKFTAAFKWDLQVKNFLGKPVEVSSDSTEVQAKIVETEKDKAWKVSLTAATALTKGANITVKFDKSSANYQIWCFDQKPDGAYPDTPAPERKYTLSGTVGTEVPTLTQIAEYMPALNGWGFTSAVQTEITFDGSAIAYIYYYRTFSLVSFNLDGGINGPKAIFARQGSALKVSEDDYPTKAGYTFSGFYNGYSPMPSTIPNVDTTYTAAWTPNSSTANVYLVYWGENANDTNYSYIRDIVVSGQKVGSKFVLTNHQANPGGNAELERMWYNERYKCQYASQVTYDKNVTVNQSGFTIVNVYIQRKTFTWEFCSSSWGDFSRTKPAITVTAKFDADVYAKFQEANVAAYGDAYKDSAPWLVRNSGGLITYANLLTNMSTTNHNIHTASSENASYRKVDDRSSDRVLFKYFIQKIDSDYTHGTIKQGEEQTDTAKNFDKYHFVSLAATGDGGDMQFSEDEYIDIEGFTAPEGDGINGPKLKSRVYYWKDSWHTQKAGYSIYYARNNHAIALNKIVKAPDSQYDYSGTLYKVDYDKPIKDVPIPDSWIGKVGYLNNENGPQTFGNFTPFNPGGVAADSNLVFGGWVFDQAGQGDPIDIEKTKMPNANVNLYAKWVAPKVSVKFNETNDPTQPETGSIVTTFSDVTYNTQLKDYETAELKIPEIKHFYNEDDEMTYEGVARYYYDSDADKAAGKKTYFNPHTMAVPGHDITVYTEYENVQVLSYTVKFVLQNTEIEVASPRSGFAYKGESITLTPKTGNELYFDYRATYVPTSPGQTVKIDTEDQVIKFEYVVSTSVNLRYNVYYVIKDLLPEAWKEGDEVPEAALLEHVFKDKLQVSTVDVKVKDFEGVSRLEDTPDVQTIVLNLDSDNNAYFFYKENTVKINYKLKVNGVETESVEGVTIQPTTQDVNVITGVASAKITIAGTVAQYEFSNWTKSDDETFSDTNKELSVNAPANHWTACTFYANLSTSKITLQIKTASSMTSYGHIEDSDEAEGDITVQVPYGTHYVVAGDKITFSNADKSDWVKAVGDNGDLYFYDFDYWTINSESGPEITQKEDNLNANTTFYAFFAQGAISVNFKVRQVDGKDFGGKTSETHLLIKKLAYFKINTTTGEFTFSEDPAGTQVLNTVTVTPDTNFVFGKWCDGDGTTELTEGQLPDGTTVQVKTFTVWFNWKPLELDFTTDGHGKVMSGASEVTETQYVPYGTTYAVNEETGEITLTAPEGYWGEALGTYTLNPNDGYEFYYWATNPKIVGQTILTDYVCTAYFKLKTFKVTFTVYNEKTGAENYVAGSGAAFFKEVPYGTTWTVENNVATFYYAAGGKYEIATAMSDTGNHFVKWTIGASDPITGVQTVTGNANIGAHFDVDKFTITVVSNDTNLGTVSPESITDVPYGSTILTNNKSINVTNSDPSFSKSSTATEKSGAHSIFDKWTIDDKAIIATRVIKDLTVVANFKHSNVHVKFTSADATKGLVGVVEGTPDVELDIPWGTTFMIDKLNGNVQLNDYEKHYCNVYPHEGDDGHYKFDYWGVEDDTNPLEMDKLISIEPTDDSVIYKCHFDVVMCNVYFYNVYGTQEAQRGTIKKGDTETDKIQVPWGTDYNITQDTSHSKIIEREWSKITFDVDEANEDVVIQATADVASGYFWDGWYETFTEKENNDGTITYEKNFYAVFWEANDIRVTVNYWKQPVVDGQLVTDHSQYKLESQLSTNATFNTPMDVPLLDPCPEYYIQPEPQTIQVTEPEYIVDPTLPYIVNYYYDRETFNLTVEYVIDDDSNVDVPDPYKANIAWGVEYNVPSPEVEGYVADKPVVAGEMPTEDYTEVVTYSKYVPPIPPEPEPESEDITAQTGDTLMSLIGVIIAVVALAGIGIFANRRRTVVRGKHSIR